jgi:hypothetical protein
MAIQDREFGEVENAELNTAGFEHHNSHYLAFLLRYFEPFTGGLLPSVQL